MASLVTRVHRRLLRSVTLPAPLTSIRVSAAGRTFVAPVMDGRYAEPAEPWIVDLFRRLLGARQGTFLDVGVNIGQTLMVVKAIDPGRRYVGFEPNPRCIAYCERLIALNGIEGTTLVPAGLAEASGLRRLQFYTATTLDSTASLVEDFRPGQKVYGEVIVAVVSMQDAAKALDLGPLALVKIDTEGAESEILLAMREALAAHRPWIVTEVLPPYSAENTVRMARQATIEDTPQDPRLPHPADRPVGRRRTRRSRGDRDVRRSRGSREVGLRPRARRRRRHDHGPGPPALAQGLRARGGVRKRHLSSKTASGMRSPSGTARKAGRCGRIRGSPAAGSG